MNLSDIITQDCTLCAVPATSKKKMLEILSQQAAEFNPGYNTYQLLESLLTREKMGSTGIGNGIAIPHGRLSHGDQVMVVVATSKTPIDFDAIDNRPVDIFIALFVPEDQCQQHLSTLQSIAQIFSDKQVCKMARKCQSNEQLYQLVKNHN